MTRTVLAAVAFCQLGLTRNVAAQDHTVDVPKLSFGIAIGRHSGSLLWDIPVQEVSAGIDPATIDAKHPNGLPYPTSDFHLRREIKIGMTFSAHVNGYLNEHIGITGEFTYLGLQFNDTCALVRDGGTALLREACTKVGSDQLGIDQSASAFLLQTGVVIRPFKPATIQPYLKGLLGIANTPRNSVAMQTQLINPMDGPVALIIYPDNAWSSTRVVETGGVGLTMAPINGMQFLVEYRVSWLTQLAVTGPTTSQGVAPPTESVRKAVQSILFGFDFVLKKEHGKRY